jgi:N-acetylglucosaminyldiphosphoundecaprenol N-acetyl-beta-D-mannosaminyltransferase
MQPSGAGQLIEPALDEGLGPVAGPPSRLMNGLQRALPVVPRVDVLGIGISAIDMDQALETIDDWITTGAHQYVCVTGVHGVMESQRDDGLRRIHNEAGLVTPEGMPLVWLSRWYGWRRTSRVYGPDLLLAVCERSMTTGYRHFFYGGQQAVADRLVSRLERRFPGLSVAGTYAPAFHELRVEEREDVVRRINDAGADIVWVGLGTPKQERWMAERVGRLDAAVLIGIGSAFDLHAGLKRQAPGWMRRNGLEWLFRLSMEPRRLGRRYLRENPAFVWLTMRHLWRARRQARG